MKHIIKLPTMILGLAIISLGEALDCIGNFMVEIADGPGNDLGDTGHVFIKNPKGRYFDL